MVQLEKISIFWVVCKKPRVLTTVTCLRNGLAIAWLRQWVQKEEPLYGDEDEEHRADVTSQRGFPVASADNFLGVLAGFQRTLMGLIVLTQKCLTKMEMP